MPPVALLITAGTLNGFILPVSLGLLLIAVTKKRIVGDYKHPVWMSIIGWAAVASILLAVKVAAGIAKWLFLR